MSKRTKSIPLSPKHGLNPSITHCKCCGKETGIALFGKMKGDIEAPKEVYQGYCDECKKVIDADGLMIIEVRDGESGDNPYRTGRIIGLTKEGKEKVFHDVDSPVCYMEHSLFSSVFDSVLINSDLQ